VITVWFLLALVAFPDIPAINYKGFYAYNTKEECEMQKISLENFLVDRELKQGKTTLYVETYCLEMQAFPKQLQKYKENKQNGIGLGGQNLGA